MGFDRLIVEFDKSLRTVFAPAVSVRNVSGTAGVNSDINATERRHAASLMRVNHAGEVCAQALYQGQAVSSSSPQIRAELEKAAQEETDHLAWTEARIVALGGRKSLLNPFWYAGAFAMGVLAGRLGDAWNLGFLAETERQVEAHLSSHLERLPLADRESRAVLVQMRADEMAHVETAIRLGATELPSPVKLAMKVSSRVMTATAYYI
jgi:ubiquinone biosynthesis monooxygenase Coq7